MANDDRRQTIDEFDEAVNMTRKELENWLETGESRSVGQGEGESKGHESGCRIVKLLENKFYYTDDDLNRFPRWAVALDLPEPTDTRYSSEIPKKTNGERRPVEQKLRLRYQALVVSSNGITISDPHRPDNR